MNGSVGALLGLALALGAMLVVVGAPPVRAVKLSQRLAPFLADRAAVAEFAVEPNPVRRWLKPALRASVRWLDRLVGGSESVRRRLGGLGSSSSVEEFRIEQVVWGGIGLIGGAFGLLLLTGVRGGVDPLLSAGGAVLGGIGGVAGRDWYLSRQLRTRERVMLSEFPIIADVMALAVVAGEAPIDAVQRVCRLTSGELTKDLQAALDEARAGTPISSALSELASRSTLDAFSRFVQGLVVAIERGTPLSAVLHAQATDARETAKRALLEAGGQKELQMMVPVVFLILPVTVLFALYPGLLTLVSLSH
ncbi:MAG TPA: type II secretion system F family protein [Jatrophihabitans sp.]|nr:type II secretion system F family protein [Jatrophihabitans sp.]